LATPATFSPPRVTRGDLHALAEQLYADDADVVPRDTRMPTATWPVGAEFRPRPALADLPASGPFAATNQSRATAAAGWVMTARSGQNGVVVAAGAGDQPRPAKITDREGDLGRRRRRNVMESHEDAYGVGYGRGRRWLARSKPPGPHRWSNTSNRSGRVGRARTP